jgi:serine phosphatase RsbU (regulator of sigma subunit)
VVLPHHEVAARMIPALDVGGDYYDVIQQEDALWILIGDVSGHGVSAGLIMMMVQTAVRTALCTPAVTPAQLLATVNTAVTENLRRIGANQYMTISALRFEGARVTYAGRHQHLLLYRAASAEVAFIETDGTWLGILDEISGLVSDHRIELSAGDVLLLYTDGVTEVSDGSELLDTKGLAKLFARHARETPPLPVLIDRILEEVRHGPIDDDMTLMAVRMRD